MRCPNCEFENREGVNFCEECGEKLEQPIPGLCPYCGFQNREGVNFCEECGTRLETEQPLPSKKKHAAKKAKPAKKTERKPRRKPKPIPEPKPQPQQRSQPESVSQQTPPQTVVVQVQQEKKRRFNPLWLALLLLLLVISCGCLMMYDVVVPPASVASAVDPMLEAVRVRIPPGIDRAIGGVAEGLGAQPGGDGGVANDDNNAGNANQPAEVAPPGDQVCEQLNDHFNSGELQSLVTCAEDSNGQISDDECRISVDMWDIMDDDLDKLPMDEIREKGFEVRYRWKNGKSGIVKITDTCTVLNWCNNIPRDPNSDRLDYTILYEGCEIGKDYSDGRLIEDAPPPADPECCSNTGFYNIYYEAGLLYFDIECKNERFAEQTARGTVYDGAGNFWTDVECKVENNDAFSFFECEGLNAVSVKSGAVRIEMEYEDAAGNICQIEDAGGSFQPPAMCPDGQSLCAGSCCSEGHCCTCNGKLGCWQSCSGCD